MQMIQCFESYEGKTIYREEWQDQIFAQNQEGESIH